MRIYKTTSGGIALESEGIVKRSAQTDWDAYINRDGLHALVRAEFDDAQTDRKTPEWLAEQTVLPPIQQQEIWASGVTYLRSRDARMDESKAAGGTPGGASVFYDNVYAAERPELFFKANAGRTVGTNDSVRIRRDSTWNVPEPELTLFITSSGAIAGYTIGNDMSSRSIEGENPLYLPQAKTYDRCAGLGPCLLVTATPIDPATLITLTINRGQEPAFSAQIAINQMKRQHQELVDYLFRECSFPHGVFLMTGTGIVPPNGFTLQSGDEILITIEGIGTLRNLVD
ncbi:MAG: fumarylacetoacetate hydrolase family protein [Bacteroidetes bacterium]|nr:fumarylacetoacetate hydrolase family protein [Fibrella sp.]